MRLTLRTLLAYIDDTLPPAEAATIGRKVAESDTAPALVEKIRKLTRKRSLATPTGSETGSPSDPNTVAEYLSDSLAPDLVADFESICLESDLHLAEAAACHQILTLLLSEPARVPPTARKRMYELVTGPESLPNRKPGAVIPVGGLPPAVESNDSPDRDAGLLMGLTGKGSQPIRWLLAIALLLGSFAGFWAAWPKPHEPAAATDKPTVMP
jgi:hypothetical protein